MAKESYRLSKAGMEGVYETEGACSKKALVDLAAQKETTADKTEGAAPDKILKEVAKKGPTAEEIVEPTIKRFAAKGVEEIAVLGDVPTHTSPDHDPRDTIRDAAARGGVAADDNLEEEVEETEGTGPKEPPRHAAREYGTSENTRGDLHNELREPAIERCDVAGVGPEDPLMDDAALKDIAADDSDARSLKDTGDWRNLSEEAGLEDIAASTPLRRTQRFRKKTGKTKGF